MHSTPSAEELLLLQEAGFDERDGTRAVVANQVSQVSGIYFLSAAGANLIKIGFVQNIDKIARRVDALQAGCPYALVNVFVARGASRREEWRAHRLFEEYRFRAEWFRCDGRLKSFLQFAVAYPDEASRRLRLQLED
ncbi:hypothetical protein FIU89_11190 [Roseovarius sp. THAF27]|uniref:GIY-YIG nuclease family protein n=1 Tax=Roseovarius sp. THAF27 TaxID=2587850 RepID=UPI0012679870|nr:GIY-YIG nuclease family protein [Roseovarius sp. THAF27]QFT81174.1 hypothetical protein FIU89_11190 [Roseovarius sp. THAF27]